MKTIRVATVALNQTASDWYGNATRIADALDALRKDDVGVGCFPELCISGYGCEDGFTHPSTWQQSEQILTELLPKTRGLVVNLGLPLAFRKAIFNATAVIADGEIVGVIPKKALAGDGIHYEPRWFKPWPDGVVEETMLCGQEVPIGDLLFDFGGVRVGYEICEEAWAADRPGRRHASNGLDIECNPSASHFSFSKKRVRELFVREGSRAFGCAYLYSNLLGCESGRQIYDGGNLIALDGEIISRTERFTYGDHAIATADIDLDYTRSLFAKKHWSAPELGDDSCLCVEVDFRPKEVSTQPEYEIAAEPDWETSEEHVFEEFSRAVPFALFDYLRKSRSRGFVVSLSGGCDSACVSVLVRLTIERALESLGIDPFRDRLSYISNLPKDLQKLCKQMLITVWQETENNSAETKEAAAEIASGVGSKHLEVSVDEMVSSYQGMIENALGTSLNYKEHGLVLQNLQARVRNPMPWALANFHGMLLLTTSNRSESALGYCTMDGDTAGGFNPIGGVDKAFLRRWLQWMEDVGPIGRGEFAGLSKVNNLSPSAELLPLEEQQTDEGDLGPYEVCTFIEEHFMRRGQSPDEIFTALVEHFGNDWKEEELRYWLVRFFELFSRNQWKRERLAPCFHVDHMNLDPRTWCRWPILNGGFAKELEELKKK